MQSSSSPSLRVLQVCSIKGRGGTGYMAARICRLLHEAGHHVVVGACAGSKMEERARDNAIPRLDGLALRRGFRPLSLWNDVRRLRACILRENIQIVHAWHSIEYWTCALAVLGTSACLVRTRGLVTPLRGHLFNKLVHRRTAAVMATCQRIEDNYRSAGFSMENVFRLNDGVDTTRFSPGGDRCAIRQEADVPDDAFLLASIGRLEAVKHQETLLRALAQLPPQAHAVLAGDGSLRASLEALAADLGIAGRVHFLGVRADVERVLAGADAYVLCSVGSEGSSRATLEAMAAGVPVVTTMVGMLPDIVKPGRTGLLFPSEDAPELAECLRNLMMDARMRQRLASEARQMVEADYSEQSMCRRVEEIYRRILHAD